MILKLCGWPGCNKLAIIDPYYCPEHRAAADRRAKENAFKNATRYADYSNPEWRKLRSKMLSVHKCCQRCGASGVKLHVHHIEPVRQNPSRFLDETNLIVLCESCHAVETQKEIDSRRA